MLICISGFLPIVMEITYGLAVLLSYDEDAYFRCPPDQQRCFVNAQLYFEALNIYNHKSTFINGIGRLADKSISPLL